MSNWTADISASFKQKPLTSLLELLGIAVIFASILDYAYEYHLRAIIHQYLMSHHLLSVERHIITDYSSLKIIPISHLTVILILWLTALIHLLLCFSGIRKGPCLRIGPIRCLNKKPLLAWSAYIYFAIAAVMGGLFCLPTINPHAKIIVVVIFNVLYLSAMWVISSKRLRVRSHAYAFIICGTNAGIALLITVFELAFLSSTHESFLVIYLITFVSLSLFAWALFHESEGQANQQQSAATLFNVEAWKLLGLLWAVLFFQGLPLLSTSPEKIIYRLGLGQYEVKLVDLKPNVSQRVSQLQCPQQAGIYRCWLIVATNNEIVLAANANLESRHDSFRPSEIHILG